MAAWLELTRLLLRSDLRRGWTWRSRVLIAALCAGVGTWAALAPQARLDAAERLRLGFHASLIIGLGAVVFCVIGSRAALLTEVVNPRARLAFVTACLLRGLAAALAALPLLMLPLGIQIVRVDDLFVGAPFLPAIFHAPWQRALFDVLLVGLFGAHLWVKAIICARASSLSVPNLAHELLTGSTVAEICARLQARSWRRTRALVLALAICNGALCLALPFVPNLPLDADAKKLLQIVLVVGIGLLFLDASALRWKGALLGICGRPFAPTLLFTLGSPWAIAWLFWSFHSGEALGTEGVIAFFLLWLALSFVTSSLVRAGAKAKLHASLRALVSAHL